MRKAHKSKIERNKRIAEIYAESKSLEAAGAPFGLGIQQTRLILHSLAIPMQDNRGKRQVVPPEVIERNKQLILNILKIILYRNAATSSE